MHTFALRVAVLCSIGGALCSAPAQEATPASSADIPRPLSPSVSILEGHHAPSGTRYARLFLIASSVAGSATPPPTLTIQCTELNRKRTVSLFVNFGGVTDQSFPAPFHRTNTELFPPQNPTLSLDMRFVGYITSKPFRRDWEQLPSGNLRYRNPGMDSRNLDGPAFFLGYLRSLPQLRIGDAHRKDPAASAVFDTAPLLDAMQHTALCQ